MSRLETFGGLALIGSDGSRIPVQRRRLALLAVLAAAGRRGVPRERLDACFWPDSSPEKARHALVQLLHLLRRQLGEDLYLGPDPVILNSARLTSDIGEFDAALEERRYADAVSLYAGPFLDGFHLLDATEFGRWAERERDRIADAHRSALERLASEAARTGNVEAAASRWRSLVALDPLNTRYVLGLMRTLAATGHGAEALRAASAHVGQVQQELECAPDPEVLALAESLRTAPSIEPNYPAFNEDASPVAPPPAATATPSVGSRRRTAGFAIVAGLVLAALGIAGLLRQPSDRAPEPYRIAVLPFEVTSADTSDQYLSFEIADLLSLRLDGAAGRMPVDFGAVTHALHEAPSADGSREEAAIRAARRLGAGMVVLGDVIRSDGSHLILNGRAFSVADGRPAEHAMVDGPQDSLPALVERLATTLLALGSEAGATPASLDHIPAAAIRAYLEGRSRFREGQYYYAGLAFDRALEIDSTFLQAAVGQTISSMWTGMSPRGLALAWAGRNRVSLGDRALIEAAAGPRYPDPPTERETLDAWERASLADPDRAEVWFALGDRYLRWGATLGVSDWQVRARNAFNRAAGLDSLLNGPLEGLLWLSLGSADTGGIRRLGARLLRPNASPEDAVLVRWLVASADSDQVAVRMIRDGFDRLKPVLLYHIAMKSQEVPLDPVDGARAATVFRRVAASARERLSALTLAHDMEMNAGMEERASELLEATPPLEGELASQATGWTPFPHTSVRARILDALYWNGDSRKAAVAAASLARGIVDAQQPLEPTAAADQCVLAQWQLSQRQAAAAEQSIDRLAALVLGSNDYTTRSRGFKCLTFLRATLNVRLQRPAAATLISRLDSLMKEGQPPFVEFEYLPLALSRLYESEGRFDAALAALRRRGPFSGLKYLSSYLTAEARLAGLAGDRAGALHALRHLERLRGK